MGDRYVSIWFEHLLPDWLVRRQPDLKATPFVLCRSERGRMIVTTASPAAAEAGIAAGMALADARALQPLLNSFDDKPALPGQLLAALGD